VVKTPSPSRVSPLVRWTVVAAMLTAAGSLGVAFVTDTPVREPAAAASQPVHAAPGQLAGRAPSLPVDRIVVVTSDVFQRTRRLQLRVEAHIDLAEVASQVQELRRHHRHAPVAVVFSRGLKPDERGLVLEQLAEAGVTDVQATEAR
jgi:hypothetical protein